MPSNFVTLLKKVWIHGTERKGLELRLRILRLFGGILVPEYRFQDPHIDWWFDTKFSDFLKRAGESRLSSNDRRWILGQLVRLTGNVPGETAECGVYRGTGSEIICLANSQSSWLKGKTHHIFDSFEGLSAPAKDKDGSHWFEGQLSYGLEGVKKKLLRFEYVRYYAGWIPCRFPEVATLNFSFVHIDVDLHDPTRESLEFFYPRLSVGGIMLCDDYGTQTCPGATLACNEFLADKPEKMLGLTGGGGFFIKGVETDEPVDFSC